MIWTWLWACRGLDDPSVARQHTRALGPLLQPLAARRVTTLRDQDWCRAIAYDRGHYVDSSHPSTCGLDSAPSSPFDARAQADLQAFLAPIRQRGLQPMIVSLGYDPQGALQRAELELPQAWSLGAVRYQWAPAEPPVPEPAERAVTPLGGDWYLVLEDWN